MSVFYRLAVARDVRKQEEARSLAASEGKELDDEFVYVS